MKIVTEPLYGDGYIAYDPHSQEGEIAVYPIGYGETEQEAIDDLLEQMEEAA